jgi:hypothetical protein
MAKSDAVKRTLNAPSPSRQLAFHQLLVAARKLWLVDALTEALAEVDPATIKLEITRTAPKDVLKLLAVAGIRDEHIFPTPSVLRAKPTLVGYYRLLLGTSQKTFYGDGRSEEHGTQSFANPPANCFASRVLPDNGRCDCRVDSPNLTGGDPA